MADNGVMMFVISIFSSILFITTNAQVDRMHCRNPLGMQDKRIPDDHLEASSFHARGTGPIFARLEREEGDGAWCPKGVIDKDDRSQYLQVKLPSLSFLSIVATQGRDAGGAGQEYIPSYALNYSRDGITWFQWKNYRGVSVLEGNQDPKNVVHRKLNPGIPSVRYLRLIPVTTRPRSVCARIELYGCPMPSGVVSYSMPVPGVPLQDGDEVSKTLNEKWSFGDEYYDGIRETESFHSGLGQLTDGVIGSNKINETKSSVSSRKIGFDYVGWRNNRRGDRYISLTFSFEEVRNFTAMRIHTLTSENVGSRFFSNVAVAFSLDGRTYPNTPYASKVAYDVPNREGENTRFIEVPLGRAMARYVRAKFRIRGDWMLISEVEFVAGKVSSTFEAANKEALDGGQNGISTEPSVTTTENNNIIIIVCSLAGIIALLILIVVFLVYRQRRLRKTMSPPRYSYSAATPAVPGPNPNVTLCLTGQRAAFTSTTACAVPMQEKCSDPLYHEIAGGRGIMAPNVYLEPNDVLKPGQRMPEVTQLAHQSMGRDRRFEQPDVTMCASGVRDGVMTISHYAESNVRALPPPYATPLQGAFGNNVYAVPWTSQSPAPTKRTKYLSPPKYTATPSEASTLLADDSQDDIASQSVMSQRCGENGAVEFPRERLEFVEKLGEGQFGEVRLCKADASLRRYVEQDGISIDGNSDEPVLVAVKVLREDATPNAKEDFLKEVKVMARLRDPNIVQLLAVCTEDEPFAMITGYMENGDLNEYLRGFDIDETSYRTQERSSVDQPTCSSQLPTISRTILMSMAAQIAAGMKYLSSLNFVHRDLATRNCLVGNDHTIRIADFGMSRNMYQGDYYKIQGKAVLPIRWMSWECVLLGKFSTASDVWAFGVTLWELFTLCKCQPYHSLDDQQIIENMHHIYQRTGEEVYLPKPKACPTSVFNMVKQCWKRECDERPAFDSLYSFLKERV
uniref:discoidin domain-containing receptor 2-like n=1 Tax=Styela clava TaxID=7725 RepID=UPI00193A04D7|nr:discoidin domain-containing receptor 2-like [Styela clava]